MVNKLINCDFELINSIAKNDYLEDTSDEFKKSFQLLAEEVLSRPEVQKQVNRVLQDEKNIIENEKDIILDKEKRHEIEFFYLFR